MKKMLLDSLTKLKKNWVLILGVFAMFLLILGTFSRGGSLTQKTLFVIGAPLLGVTAYLNKQKMFTVLQIVVSVGAVLGFFVNLSTYWRYTLMLGIAIASVVYLLFKKYYSEDKWGIIGTAGLICFAYALATNAATEIVLFNTLIIIGGILVATYSSLCFFISKVKISLIWIILNILLCVNPVIILLSLYLY